MHIHKLKQASVSSITSLATSIAPQTDSNELDKLPYMATSTWLVFSAVYVDEDDDFVLTKAIATHLAFPTSFGLQRGSIVGERDYLTFTIFNFQCLRIEHRFFVSLLRHGLLVVVGYCQKAEKQGENTLLLSLLTITNDDEQPMSEERNKKTAFYSKAVRRSSNHTSTTSAVPYIVIGHSIASGGSEGIHDVDYNFRTHRWAASEVRVVARASLMHIVACRN
eukprot:scaffold224715_cov30-Prasinocladus_malaysianus.AAC.3